LRPVLLLTDPVGPIPEILVAYVSSVLPVSSLPSDLLIDPVSPEGRPSNLKVRSVVRLHKLATIHVSTVVRRLGELSSVLRPTVAEKLSALLQIELMSGEARLEGGPAWLTSRVNEAFCKVVELLAQPKLPFDRSLRSTLPAEPGLYAISRQEGYLRAGRTDEGGLRQRVYQNHFMGNQAGNLRQQLVRARLCDDLEQAKQWIRQNCSVQVLVVQNDETRKWTEHLLRSALRPMFSD